MIIEHAVFAPVVFGAFKAHLKKFPASSEPASATPADHCPTRPTGRFPAEKPDMPKPSKSIMTRK